MPKFNINSVPVAHMASQSRAKQLATRDSQHKLQKSIVEWEGRQQDKSGEQIYKQILEELEKLYNTSKSINDYFKEQQVLADVGYPILYNKTEQQLKMAYEYTKEQEDNLIAQIKNDRFYHGLSNSVDSSELPVLQSDSKTSYWGNENSSVSSVLLESISTIIETERKFLIGAATVYPVYSKEYSFPENLVLENYPFADKNDMVLFGDYQFGGHRYFKDPLIFGPEDCSSSVGKATYLTTEQIKSITTREMRENYAKYDYKLVATLNDIDQKQLDLIKPGDIYLYKTHTAVIATSPDNLSNITTLQFARDIDREEQKLLGGGLYNYNLSEKLKEDSTNPIYILRAEELEPLCEKIPLADFLNIVDNKYSELYQDGPTEDVVGDCSVFFE